MLEPCFLRRKPFALSWRVSTGARSLAETISYHKLGFQIFQLISKCKNFFRPALEEKTLAFQIKIHLRSTASVPILKHGVNPPEKDILPS